MFRPPRRRRVRRNGVSSGVFVFYVVGAGAYRLGQHGFARDAHPEPLAHGKAEAKRLRAAVVEEVHARGEALKLQRVGQHLPQSGLPLRRPLDLDDLGRRDDVREPAAARDLGPAPELPRQAVAHPPLAPRRNAPRLAFPRPASARAARGGGANIIGLRARLCARLRARLCAASAAAAIIMGPRACPRGAFAAAAIIIGPRGAAPAGKEGPCKGAPHPCM